MATSPPAASRARRPRRGHPSSASDATLAAVGEFLSPREIVELLMVIGNYMMVARVMATTHMELDEPVDPVALRATS